MGKQSFRLQPFHPAPIRSEGHQRTRHPRRLRSRPIRLSVAHKEGLGQHAPGLLDRRDIRFWIGFRHAHRLGPNHRTEQIAHAKPGQQTIRQIFRLVGTYPHGIPAPAQFLDRIRRPVIKPGVCVDVLRVDIEQDRILLHHLRFTEPRFHTGKSERQHRPPTAKRRMRIPLRVQHIAISQPPETSIRRRDQIGGGVRQRAVEIENHSAHVRSLLRQRRPALGKLPLNAVIWRQNK